MSDTSIKSFILNTKLELDNTKTTPINTSFIENSDVFVITDEIDDVLNPKKSELNYPRNLNELYKKNYSLFIIEILTFLIENIILKEDLLTKYSK